MTAAFLYAAVRTPFGRFGGALAEVRPDDLAAIAITGAAGQGARTWTRPRSATSRWGCANQAGEDNRNVGRMAVLLAGLPVSVPATTVNRLCGSSLDAAMIGSRVIESGDADVVADRRRRVDDPGAVGAAEAVAGRSRPATSRRCRPTLGWRLVNENMPAEWTVSLGEANELLGEKFAISRERQDEFAARSHAARRRGLGRRVLRRPGRAGAGDLTRATRASGRARPPEKLAGLQAVVPSRRDDHRRATPPRSTTGRPPCCSARRTRRSASTRSPGSPGAGWLRWSRRCSATRRSRPRTARSPGPASAGPTCRRVELNEAFAVQSLACVDAWGDRPGDRQRQGRRDRDRPPARRVRRPDPRHPGRAAARVRRPVRRGRDLHRRRAGARRRAGERRRDATICDTAAEAVAGIEDGSTVLVGGFGMAGHAGRADRRADRAGRERPHRGVEQRRQRRHRPGRAAGQGPGAEDGLLVPAAARLLGLRRALPRRQDRARAGAAGQPRRADARGRCRDRRVLLARPASARRWPRARRRGRSTAATYVLEYPIRGDVALIGAHRADRMGNLVYRKTARNFGPVMATAADDDGRPGRARSSRSAGSTPRPS